MTAMPLDPASSTAPATLFRADELKRVGIAAAMIAVCGTIVIVAVTMTIGHYNPLVHCGPIAILKGAVIALLIGRSGRWRCLALLGVVYGFVLLLQIGVFYLLPVTILAGAVAALAGWTTQSINRTAAVVLAAAVFELASTLGAPIKIYFGTADGREPFIWALWLAEWPLRLAGATIGVMLATRWQLRRAAAMPVAVSVPVAQADFSDALQLDLRRDRILVRRPTSRPFPLIVLLRLLMCMLAGSLPMFVQSLAALAIIASIYCLYAVASGVSRRAFFAALGLIWGWLMFGALSYAWHRDFDRVLDLSRTLVLRFTPIAMSSAVLIVQTRGLDVVRLLRRLKLPAVLILPLSTVIRAIPRSRQSLRRSIHELRAQGHWSGPFSMIRHPRIVFRQLLAPQVRHWAEELAEDA